jgi:hypothetical protein
MNRITFGMLLILLSQIFTSTMAIISRQGDIPLYNAIFICSMMILLGMQEVIDKLERLERK